jgi:hypothetical protein
MLFAAAMSRLAREHNNSGGLLSVKRRSLFSAWPCMPVELQRDVQPCAEIIHFNNAGSSLPHPDVTEAGALQVR